jgi:hypothetical protein
MSLLSWVREFESKFGSDELLKNIKDSHMHGNIQINFCNGTPVNYNITIHKRGAVSYSNNAAYTSDTSSANTNTQVTFTQTKGKEE